MYVLYPPVSPVARANWAIAKSDAEYSSESDGSSSMKCCDSYSPSRPRIALPWVLPPVALFFMRLSAAAVSKSRAPNA
jgi:hypothetical protein